MLPEITTLSSRVASDNLPDWFRPCVAELLGTGRAEELRVAKIPGGANNRVYRAEVGSDIYAVKWYFSAPDDPRDRLDAEWRFAQFAWTQGLRQLAKPLACDRQFGIAVFEFITGRRLGTEELTGEHVRAASEFILGLNRSRDSADAAGLPNASEACFTLAAHIHCLEQRVAHLLASAASTTNTPAAEFITKRLTPTADRVVESIRARINEQEGFEAEDLAQADRIISPSDFGFHNALLDSQGQLRFFDFEYAGWDDPAKTVCDFFSQVQVPVPRSHRASFVAALSSLAGPNLERRADLLQPLYLIKWCCIVLNPLVKVGRERREFSAGREVEVTDCLEKANRILASLQE